MASDRCGGGERSSGRARRCGSRVRNFVHLAVVDPGTQKRRWTRAEEATGGWKHPHPGPGFAAWPARRRLQRRSGANSVGPSRFRITVARSVLASSKRYSLSNPPGAARRSVSLSITSAGDRVRSSAHDSIPEEAGARRTMLAHSFETTVRGQVPSAANSAGRS